jgi:hypothetical protein
MDGHHFQVLLLQTEDDLEFLIALEKSLNILDSAFNFSNRI